MPFGQIPFSPAAPASYFVPTMQQAPRAYFPGQVGQVRPAQRWPAAQQIRVNSQYPVAGQTIAAGNFPRQTRPSMPVQNANAQARSAMNAARPITGQMATAGGAGNRVTGRVAGGVAPQPVPQSRPTTYKYTGAARNITPAGNPGNASVNASNAVLVQGQEPLTTQMLAEASPREQKQMLGERLFPLIYSMHSELAGKITGMLLEIDNSELLHMLEHEESLKAKVEEAVAVLQAHQAKEELTRQQVTPAAVPTLAAPAPAVAPAPVAPAAPTGAPRTMAEVVAAGKKE